MSFIRTRCSALLLLLAGAAAAQRPRLEAGVQTGALDERGALGEKPAVAGGRLSLRAWRLLDAEVEIDRFPVGGGRANFPGTEFLFGARAGYRAGPLGLFATVRPGFVRFDGTPNEPTFGTRPALGLGAAVAGYSRRHVFVRFDAGDLILSYGGGVGARHHFQGTAGFGLWF